MRSEHGNSAPAYQFRRLELTDKRRWWDTLMTMAGVKCGVKPPKFVVYKPKISHMSL